MSKLTGAEIVRQVSKGQIVLDPFEPENVGPNSVDLTLGDQLLIYDRNPRGRVTLDMKEDNPTRIIRIPDEGLVLNPHMLYLGVTRERAGSDAFASTIAGRSSVGRLGLFVHVTAGFGDLGFKGCWTLELVATHRVRVYAGVRIAQIAFETIEGEIGERYDKEHRGKYGTQNEAIPVASRLFRDFEAA